MKTSAGRERARPPLGGLAGWVMARWRRGQGAGPRMTLVERIALGPRQTLALVEADGRRFLVAHSAEGAPAFFALDDRAGAPAKRPSGAAMKAPGRVSW